MASHDSRILDQFTRQAAPFAAAAAIRNQEALDRIVQWSDAGPDDTVLDVACGPGLLACAFAKVAQHATGVDMTPAMLEQARKTQQEQGIKNVSWQPGNVYSLPFPPSQFSIVSSRFVFHHLQDPLAALNDMKRVCGPGGKIVVADMAPTASKAAACLTRPALPRRKSITTGWKANSKICSLAPFPMKATPTDCAGCTPTPLMTTH